MFNQHASSHFSVEVGGSFHCGPDHTSPKTFGWEVSINWPDSALDSNGFLLDNTSFREYFNRIQFTTDSCELLVLKAARHFHSLSPLAQNVTVTIEVPGLARISNTQP